MLEFNKVATDQVGSHFLNLGLQLSNLVVENISFPEAVEKAIDTRSTMGVMGDTMDTFVKYQAANAMRDSAKNQSGMSNIGVSLGAGAVIGDMMKESLKSNNDKPSTEKPERFCPNCGAKVSARAKFCGECGTKIIANNVCPKCGAKVSPNAKFCGECGNKLK